MWASWIAEVSCLKITWESINVGSKVTTSAWNNSYAQVFSSSYLVDFSGWIWIMPVPCCVLCVTCGYKGWTSGKQDGCQFRQSGHRFKNIHLQRNILPMLNPLSGSPGYLLFAAKYLNNTGPRLRLSWVKTAAGFWQCLGDDAENTGESEQVIFIFIRQYS